MRHPAKITLLISTTLLLIGLHGCGNKGNSDPPGVDPSTDSGSDGGGDFGGFGDGDDGGSQCLNRCSVDHHSILDCNGNLVQSCAESEGCDVRTGSCTDACTSAASDRGSVGCEFYAVPPGPYGSTNTCFAAFVANTWNSPVMLSGDSNGTPLDIAKIAYIPSGSGMATTYTPLVGNQIPIGSVAIVFLSGTGCPAGITSAGIDQGSGTRLSYGVHLVTDRPVAAYDIYPYGGGSAAITSATLLLPTTSWDTNYVAISPFAVSNLVGYPGVIHFIASQDGTQITILPTKDIQGGGGITHVPAGTPAIYNLEKGQMISFAQPNGYLLDGSSIQSNKPIGMWSSMECFNIPIDVAACDSAHQQIPPVKALGSEYALVRYRNRVPAKEETPPWRILGLVDGTVLSWEPATPVGAPTTLSAGQLAQFDGAGPYVVKSQDADHPIYVSAHMTGADAVGPDPRLGYPGDPEFVNVVPAKEFLNSYIFFTDPTYPETNLVLVRAKGDDGAFHDVTLDCADGPLTGWLPVGSSGDYQYTRTDLVTGNFEPQGKCNNGRHEIKSDAPFGITVWGWGSALTNPTVSQYVSYAYPGGMSVRPINNVVVPVIVK